MKDAVSIRQRPAAVDDRAVPGHWEGDLLSGPNNTYIATLVERQTRYVMLAKVAGKDTRTVVNALIKQSKKLPKELYKSLTRIRAGTDGSSALYYEPTSMSMQAWQRGSNNLNGLRDSTFQGLRIGACANKSDKVARQRTTRATAI
jgi:IS30 family transposase